ncbi:hypothetical protein C2845_PM13G12670 [Panicum miliaceum]|uniref:Retrotransposon Copia-like N-terminal domain-containing protein n=1 Tax=Panicum miliaceum TaxID=4540 RepID=A0A3L6RKA6_PANMI|nr:hypothetical protein C2845_PM13G12670 [Panicum miliaceum]
MALVPSITPLNGDVSYLRWKESMLLLLNTAGVAHVLSEDPPPPGSGEAARKWVRDDAVCRGHILAALSDAVFPDYVRHGTGRAVWRALARTYDVGAASVSWRKFTEFEFRLDGGGAPSFLEQLAHAEALGVAGQPSHRDLVDRTLGQKLPPDVASRAMVVLGDGSVSVSMDKAWEVARIRERNRISEDELNVRAAMAEDEEKGLVCCNFGNTGTGFSARNSRA